MAKYKVRHGLISYSVGDRTEIAFRGQVLDLSQDDVDRLEPHSAIVPEEEELSRPGGMLPLPEAATDEEIRNWVLGATEGEVRQIAELRPMLAERINAAREAVEEELEKQSEHLGQASKAAKKGAKRASTDEAPRTATEKQRSDEEVAQEVDAVVRRNVDDVSEYLSEHPDRAQAVLEAETRRAADAGDEPRRGVRQAAEAAAGHAAQ